MMMLSLEDCTGGGAEGGDSEKGGVAEASGAGASSLTPGEGPLPLSKKKLAMGRNVFWESDEEDDQHQEEEVADFKS